jgi:2-phosphosulfolactate phosphatase
MTSRSPRRLSVLFNPRDMETERLVGATAVLVDVLRATSVIPAALASGAVALFPVAGLDDAMALRAAMPDALLCGEKDGRPRPGFELGNSPSEYTPARVGGKRLVYTSTNGVPALFRLRPAARVLTAAFVNEAAVREVLQSWQGDVVLVAAGSEGRPSLEDVAFCGSLTSRLLEGVATFALDDGARMAHAVWKAWDEDVAGLLAASSHGATLISWGWDADLAWCARRDVLSVVPVLEGDRLVALGRS